ncbi:MAG: hypothetical protein JWO46_3020 [Nocardioidaceae bacterium]|nr:hypothetical protein [Nocardioidaceae bacterium]
MLLTNTFTVPVPIDRAWETLLDMERVAPCLPGAGVDSFDGKVCQGRVKVKVGPIALQYRGEVTIDQRDDSGHSLVMTGTGKEVKGAGSASARITANLVGQGATTDVHVETVLDLTGKPAQFGRGLINDVSNRLVGTFADNLKVLLEAEEAAPAPAAEPTTTAAPRPAAAEAAALDAFSLLPEPVRRGTPVVAGVVVGVLVGALLGRRGCVRR